MILIFILCILLIFWFRYQIKENFEPHKGKIAFLFLTIDNLNLPEVWEKFFKGHDNKYTVYCHPKYPDKVTDQLLKNNMISKNVSTSWGGIGTVEANLLMMQQALKDRDNQYFILCSESCVPIVKFETFYNFVFREGKTIMPFFEENSERYDSIIEPSIPKKDFKKHCAQGLIFKRKHVNILVETISEIEKWKNVYCVDEHYFYNILYWKGVDPSREIYSYKVTFDVWSESKIDRLGARNRGIKKNVSRLRDQGHRCYLLITKKFLDIIIQSGYFFMRKVCPHMNGQNYVKDIV